MAHDCREACTAGTISKELANELVLSIARFISECDAEQIRLAPEKCIDLCIWQVWYYLRTFITFCWYVEFAVISLCKRFKDQVMQLEAPIRGVAPLLTAIRKLQSSSEQLTTLHPDFLLLCVLAKCYKTGLCVLEDDIFEVDQPKDFFLYCYYGWVAFALSVFFIYFDACFWLGAEC